MQSLGTFTPSQPPGTAKGQSLARAGAQFLATPSGADWYEVASGAAPGRCAQVKSGTVVAVADDATTLFPSGCEVLIGIPSEVAIGWAWNGTSFSAPAADTLAGVKVKAGMAIDQAAERARLKYITPGDGMQLTYREKLDQAEHVAAGGKSAADALSANDAAAQYPILSASIGIEATSLWSASQLVISRYAAWATIARAIELQRLTAKKAIADAASIESVNIVLASTVWSDL